MNTKIFMVLGVFSILIIGTQATYAGPPVNDLWLFYGEIGGGKVDCKSGNNPCDVDSPLLVFGVSSVDLLGPTESYQTQANAIAGGGLSPPLIVASCWKGADDPAVDGSVTFDFGVGVTAADDVRQNQRGDADVGLGCHPPAVTVLNDNELESNELLVIDLTIPVGLGYSNFMYALSSNTDGDKAHLWASDKPPSGSVSLTSAESLGDDDLTDTYINFPTKKFLYVKEVGTSDAGDILLQQIKADVPVIGGTGIQIDTSALLLAGAQTNAYWIIPIVVSATIIGIITIRRK